MKPKLLLTIAGAYYLLDGLAGFFMVSGFDFIAWGYSIFCMSLGALFLMTRGEESSKARNAPASKTLDAVFAGAWIATLGVGLNALYGQFSGNYMDTAAGYIPGVVMLGLAVWFFLASRANESTGGS